MNKIKFEWDTTESFEPELPPREWSHGIEEVGGHAVSGAGVPATFVVRSQETITMTLRVRESEWDDCLAFLRAGMGGEEITVTYDDQTPVDVYFVSPVAGDSADFDRDPEYPRLLNVTFTIRASDGGDLGLLYYEEGGS